MDITCRYILSDQLHLNSYQVLRGAGRDHTVLRFTKSLVDLRGWGTNYTAGRGKSPHTWAGAMITNQQQKGVFGPTVNLHLGSVAQPAKRGDTRLYLGSLVRNTSSAELLFTPGQWYTLALAENAEVSRGLLLLRLLRQDAAGQVGCCRQGPQAWNRPHSSCCCRSSGIGGNNGSAGTQLCAQRCVRNALTLIASAGLRLQGDLARMLYNNKTNGGYSLRGFARQWMLTHMTRVTAVGKDWIEMERPLHVDVSMTHPAVVVK